ncbi:hypothetical protein VTK26DRAFT_6636 [Humicola hyalothermophila]
MDLSEQFDTRLRLCLTNQIVTPCLADRTPKHPHAVDSCILYSPFHFSTAHVPVGCPDTWLRGGQASARAVGFVNSPMTGRLASALVGFWKTRTTRQMLWNRSPPYHVPAQVRPGKLKAGFAVEDTVAQSKSATSTARSDFALPVEMLQPPLRPSSHPVGLVRLRSWARLEPARSSPHGIAWLVAENRCPTAAAAHRQPAFLACMKSSGGVQCQRSTELRQTRKGFPPSMQKRCSVSNEGFRLGKGPAINSGRRQVEKLGLCLVFASVPSCLGLARPNTTPEQFIVIRMIRCPCRNNQGHKPRSFCRFKTLTLIWLVVSEISFCPGFPGLGISSMQCTNTSRGPKSCVLIS